MHLLSSRYLGYDVADYMPLATPLVLLVEELVSFQRVPTTCRLNDESPEIAVAVPMDGAVPEPHLCLQDSTLLSPRKRVPNPI